MTIQERPLTKEEIQLLPSIEFEGPIQLIQNQDSLEEAVNVLSQATEIGLDTEKRPTFRKGQYYPLSLLQLATLDTVYLIQLQKTGLGTSLKALLSNRKIKKIGIALHDDIKELQKYGHFAPGSLVHLDHMAKTKGILHTGARSLTARFLGRRLSKACQKSNWGRSLLSEKQKIYAATDAWICLKIYPLLSSYEAPTPCMVMSKE